MDTHVVYDFAMQRFLIFLGGTSMTALRLSYSAMETFHQCAFRYWLRVSGAPRAPVASLIGGTAVHAALEYDGMARRDGGEGYPYEELIAHYEEALGETIANEDPGNLLEPPEVAAMRRQGHASIRAYSVLVSQMPYRPLAVEQSFEFPLTTDLSFSGRIDAITEPIEAATQAPVRTIVDFKTASRRWETGLEHRKDQAAAYLLASARDPQLGPPAKRVTFVTLPYDERSGVATADTRTTNRTPDQLEAFVTTIKAVATTIQSYTRADDFTKKTSHLCAWCPYLGACDEGRNWIDRTGARPRVHILPASTT